MNIDNMRLSRSKPQVALISYTSARGKNPEKLICVFEGFEDLPYYETMFNRLGGINEFASVIARGKDQVLGLREILLKNIQKDENVRFFIDNDFDGLKGHLAGDDVYITDGYSIENNLANTGVLSSLLSSEYKCCSDGDYQAVERINRLYEEFLQAFFEIMRPVNQAIYYARTHGIELKNIEDRIGEYFFLTLDGIAKRDADYFSLVGWPETISRDISSVEDSFAQLDPRIHWRGKFIFELFVKLLHFIKVDRTSESPKLFSKKAGVKFDPNGEIIRTLASLSPIPASLSAFVSTLQNQC